MLGCGVVQVPSFQSQWILSHYRFVSHYIIFRLSWKKTLVGNLRCWCLNMFGSTMFVRMMKMGVIIPLKLVVDHILYDPGKTRRAGLLLKIIGKFMGCCSLGDSGCEIQHPRACWHSLVVCAR